MQHSSGTSARDLMGSGIGVTVPMWPELSQFQAATDYTDQSPLLALQASHPAFSGLTLTDKNPSTVASLGTQTLEEGA